MSSDRPPTGPLPSLSDTQPGVATESPTPKSGDIMDGRYVLQDQIGEGGVGFIFRALQFKVQRPVAVKFLLREVIGEHSLKPRFEREALALAALAHPNIVRLQDYGFMRGNPFLVMEYVEGQTLRQVLTSAGGTFAVPRALALVRQMLYALAYAHERGLVHRDLKPANLVVQDLPHQPEHLKVLDFGFVKLLPGSELDRGAQLTRAGHTFGSPPYMSPEHATGSPVDGRSDLYSVGILLFEMLTGERPFEGETHELLRHHLTTTPPRLAARKPELAAHPELQALLDRALAKKREDRFANAGEFLKALDAVELGARRSAAPLARLSESPTLKEVLRMNSAYAASMTSLGLRGLPQFVAWSSTQLRKLVFRGQRAPK
ncbi:MAG TPA: serine/threonine-protein kinase [Polyangiales bacterium]|nr:serine/threonine-protein kinase [Polyangiales bacterium]